MIGNSFEILERRKPTNTRARNTMSRKTAMDSLRQGDNYLYYHLTGNSGYNGTAFSTNKKNPR